MPLHIDLLTVPEKPPFVWQSLGEKVYLLEKAGLMMNLKLEPLRVLANED